MTFPEQMYIDGALIDGAGKMDVINPATSEEVASVAVAGLAEADRALAAAKTAAPLWAATPIAERQAWMHKLREAVLAHEDHLRGCIHYEMGKSWADTQEDFDILERALAYYAEEIARVHDRALTDRAGTHAHQLVHEPVGVALAFLAWNFPLLNLAYKLAPALAAGCPIIIRPSEKTPISAYAVGALCHEIGLPAGVVQILTTESYAVADYLTASPIPDMVTLIGSTATGRHIMQTGATTIKRYSMELGGNAPVLVFPDADLDKAADVVCGIKYSNAGQICVAPNRVFVHRDVLAAFSEKVTKRAEAVAVGWDKDSDIAMGPVIDGRAWTRLKCMIDEAALNGARVLAGGARPDGLRKGHFLAPTVLTDVGEDMQVYREETFGPIVSIIPFDDDTDLARMANDGDAGGLVAYVFTRDLARAAHWSRVLRFGEIQINGVKYDIDLPHGGIGQSGIGHDCSPLALQDYLVVKRITRALETA
ncbi:succinate-semialdehyde dehydrogenase/glutarate-semialdehyde dehydrogenase [Shimia isoporae]|uniref:Succinate-semialdehyde dehydrogenase/glutarate-semialdehyde dehydrogenase n=1 Tax=Shimia isoporae TaxID=647720 RepID=A0A4R1NJV7_9RHOB|nr:aldehyde dehydrogenase family protein [Shimia isoporae]TCL08315.1 succinate-semialdehyde dehydrogenase/glutarate-semialdehyde dehydrogenase [Shimia isoporae]